MALPRAQELNEYIEFVESSPPFQATTGIGSGTHVAATAYARITEMGGSLGESDMTHLSQTVEFEIWTRGIDAVNGFMQISWGTRFLVMTAPPQKFMDANGRSWLIIRAQEVTEKGF